MEKLTLELPSEFIEQCKSDQTTPEIVLKNFIADLCSLESYSSAPRSDDYCSSGSEERRLAREYYEKVGYPFPARRPQRLSG